MRWSEQRVRRKPVSLIDAVWGSWGSLAFYRDAPAARPATAALLYLLALALVTAASVVGWRSELLAGYDRFYEVHGQRFPTLVISEAGIASATGAFQPFIVTFPESDFTVAIDTSGRLPNLESYPQGILATSDALVIKNWTGERRTPWSQGRALLELLLGTDVLSPQTLLDARGRMVNLFALGGALFALTVAFGATVVLIVFFSAMVLAVVRSRRVALRLSGAVRICVFALFPPCLVLTIAYAADRTIPSYIVVPVCLLLFSALLIRAIQAQTWRPEEDDDAGFF